MNDKIKKILVGIIIMSGTFCSGFAYDQIDASNENNRFYIAQLSFLILSAGVLGSILIYKYNKWMAWLGIASAFGVFKTFLLANAPKVNMFESTIIGFCAFIAYYFVRKLELKEDMMKWFLIPAWANIVVVLIQAFDHYPLFFLYVKGISGLIGSEGLSAAYLALTVPLFLKYCRWGVIPCFVVIIACSGAVGLLAGIFSGLVYVWYEWKKIFYYILTVVASAGLIFIFTPQFKSVKNDARLRAAMIVGSMNGVMHNPVLGWGVGSFIPVISQIPPEESEFLGKRFNSPNAIMNHPHNELVAGWWRIGIAFPILIFLIFRNFGKQFNKTKLLSYTIIMAGAIIGMGWFFTPPALLLLLMAFAIYENKEAVNG